MNKTRSKRDKWPLLWIPKKKPVEPLDDTSCAPSISDSCWPGWPRLSPRKLGPPHTTRPWHETCESVSTITGMHKLVAAETAKLNARPSELAITGKPKDRYQAETFAESCIMTLALWRRFGTLEFAQSLGWIDRCDYAAMCAVPERVVEAAVNVWKMGRHAAAGNSRPQKSVRAIEEQAWLLGNGSRSARGFSQMGFELRSVDDETSQLHSAEVSLTLARSGFEIFKSSNDLASLRAARVTPAGEASVRAAYSRLLNAIHHPIWDLWHKRQALVDVALTDCSCEKMQNALRVVKGYCGPDPDGEYAGWELAFDLMTITPLSHHSGPVEWCSDYVVWLRKRKAAKLFSDNSRFTRMSPSSPRMR